MSYMFSECGLLEELNINSFGTKNVEYMNCMFSTCTALTKLNLNNFNTGQVKNMSYIFQGCYKLEELDISNFDTKNVANMSYMFYACETLRNLGLEKNFVLPKDSNGKEYMFNKCKRIGKLSRYNDREAIIMFFIDKNVIK